ncbi:SigE family RNA polymerase sigma factor [Actinophytocola sediminis]
MRKADEDRFREFTREQAVPLRRTAYLLCGDWHLADDLTQQALIKLHGAWTRLKCEAQPVSYARKILLRCWLDERRRPWRRAERRDGELPEQPDESLRPDIRQELASLRAELFSTLSEIGPRQRAVLVLRYFESLSIAETADVLGCSEGTVKSQTTRGLAAARAVLDRTSSLSAAALMKEYL